MKIGRVCQITLFARVCTRFFAQLFVSNFIFPSIHKLLVFFFTVLQRWPLHCIGFVFQRFNTHTHTHTTEKKVEHAHTFSLNTLNYTEDKYDNFLAIQNKNGNLKKEPTSENWLYHVYHVVWQWCSIAHGIRFVYFRVVGCVCFAVNFYFYVYHIDAIAAYLLCVLCASMCVYIFAAEISNYLFILG